MFKQIQYCFQHSLQFDHFLFMLVPARHVYQVTLNLDSAALHTNTGVLAYRQNLQLPCWSLGREQLVLIHPWASVWACFVLDLVEKEFSSCRGYISVKNKLNPLSLHILLVTTHRTCTFDFPVLTEAALQGNNNSRQPGRFTRFSMDRDGNLALGTAKPLRTSEGEANLTDFFVAW